MNSTAIDDVFRRLLHALPAIQLDVWVSLAGQNVHFISDSPHGIRIANTILGPYCTLSANPPSPDITSDRALPANGALGTWTVATLAQQHVSAIVSTLQANITEIPGSPTAIRRWAGDHAAERYDIGDGRCIVVHRDPFEGLTLFSRADRRIVYLRSGESFDVPHTEHVIKYPLRVMLRAVGFSQAHASGCSLGAQGVLIIGEKGRGKSTLLVQAMSRGAKQVGNDMGYVRPTSAGRCEMIAFPHMTRLAHGTISDNSRLRSALAMEGRTGNYLTSPVFNGDKEEFYYPVLQRIWGSDPICRRTSLDLIIVPIFDVGCSAAAAIPIPREESDARLRDYLINDPPLPDWLPFFDAHDLSYIASSTAEQFLDCAPPAYELHFGPAASDPVSVIKEVLDKARTAR